MPQPVSYNPGTPVSGSIQENNISYVVDGQQRNYRGGFGGLSWMSEVPAANNVIFIGNSTSLGRGPANIPLFYPAYNNSSANIVYAANTLPGSPRNFTTTGSAYNWAVTNNFFINNSNNPIPRIDADGLALYLDANQPSSYPQTGTTWYDLSGRNNNGTLVNGPTFDNGGYITFDGVDDYCSFPVNTFNSGAPQQGTFYIRMKFPTLNTVSSTLLFYDGGISANLIYLYRNVGFSLNGYSWLIYYNRTDSQVDALLPQLPYLPNTWYDTAFTFNSSGEYRVYVNGELKSLENASLFSSWRRTGANSPFLDPASSAGTGSAQIFQWYDRPLTQAEIKQNYFQSNIVQDGLVFMVDANNLVSYPKSGTTAYALTGSNNGTLVNGVAYGYPNGGYWNFDGTDDSINIGTLSYSNNITLEAWVNTTNPTGWDDIIAGGCGDLLFGINSAGNGTLSWGGQCNVPFSPVTSTISITDGNWHHVIGTYNGSVAALYIDGNLEVSGARSGNFIPGNIAIGSVGGGGEYFNGKIANVRIYSKALTSDEVQQNYQATKDKFQGQQIVTNGLVLNLDAANKDSYPGTGTTWYDLSGNNYNATVESSMSFSSTYNGGLTTLNDATNANQRIYGTFSLSSANYTWEIWYTNNGSQGGDASGFGVTDASGVSSNGFRANSDSSVQQWVGGSLTVGQTISTASTPKQVVLRRSGTTFNSFSNGVLIDTDTAASTSATFVNYSMNCSGCTSSNNGWNGTYYIVRMYNRALSDAEILQNYNSQKTRLGL